MSACAACPLAQIYAVGLKSEKVAEARLWRQVNCAAVSGQLCWLPTAQQCAMYNMKCAMCEVNYAGPRLIAHAQQWRARLADHHPADRSCSNQPTDQTQVFLCSPASRMIMKRTSKYKTLLPLFLISCPHQDPRGPFLLTMQQQSHNGTIFSLTSLKNLLWTRQRVAYYKAQFPHKDQCGVFYFWPSVLYNLLLVGDAQFICESCS